MIIYTDGSCSGNGTTNAPGGFGIVILDDAENLVSTHSESAVRTTNNRMELSAILWVMAKYGKENPVVYSDSTYAINTLTNWSFSWKRNGWQKADKKIPENLDLITLYHKLYDRGYRIELRKCAGHSGNKWNELADELARRGTNGAKI